MMYKHSPFFGGTKTRGDLADIFNAFIEGKAAIHGWKFLACHRKVTEELVKHNIDPSDDLVKAVAAIAVHMTLSVTNPPVEAEEQTKEQK